MEVEMKSDGDVDGDRTFSLPSPHATLTRWKPDILGKDIILTPPPPNHPTPHSATLSNKPGPFAESYGITFINNFLTDSRQFCYFVITENL